MALMAILRVSSRFMASMLTFWRKNRTKPILAKRTTTITSRTVKPLRVFIFSIILRVIIRILGKLRASSHFLSNTLIIA